MQPNPNISPSPKTAQASTDRVKANPTLDSEYPTSPPAPQRVFFGGVGVGGKQSTKTAYKRMIAELRKVYR